MRIIGTIVIINILVAAAAFFKDLVLASYAGTTSYADAFTLAYFIPDTIGGNLIGTAVSVACVPLFAKLYAQGRHKLLQHSIRNVFILFSCMGIVLLAALIVFSGSLTDFIAGSEAPGRAAVILQLMLIIAPIVLLYPILSIGISAFQAMNEFKLPAAAPLVQNCLVMTTALGALFLHMQLVVGLRLISACITAGVLIMLAVIWIPLRRRLRSLQDGFPAAASETSQNTGQQRAGLLDIIKLFFPYLLILFCTQSVYFVERYLAAKLGTGTIAGLNYAFRLSQFPVWVYVAALSTVVLPPLSRFVALGHREELQQLLARAFTQILLITLPTTALFYILRVPLISALFLRGAFDEHSLYITSGIMGGYCLTIVSLALTSICLRYFLAEGRLAWPLAIFIVSSAVNIAADLYLVPVVGANGLGYGAAIGALTNAILSIYAIKHIVMFSYKTFFDKLYKITVANILLIGVLSIYERFWPLFHNSEYLRILYMAVGTLSAALIYWIVLKRMNVFETRRTVHDG